MSRQARRVNYVDRQVQGALVRRVIMHWCSFVMVSIFSVLILQLLLGDPEKSLVQHVDAAWRQYALLAFVLVALLPAFLLDTIKMSNRFVGPVMRLRRALRQVADGEQVDSLKFRDNDFWGEIATDFNRVTEQLNQTASKETPATQEAPQQAAS